jgi:hypothetical protein
MKFLQLLLYAACACGFNMESPLEAAKRLEDLVAMHTACTGSADPPSDAFPVCYKGSASVLGLSETVTITLKQLSGEKGIIDIVGEGVVHLDCTDRPISKSGQDVTVDVGKCIKNTTFDTLKYCSDSDTILLQVTQKYVPIPVSATLARIDCSAL